MSKYIAKWSDGFTVVWRNLTYSEYQNFRSRYEQSPFEEPMDISLDVYRTVCIDGPDYRLIPAGIPGFICKQQMLNNPFSGKYEDVVAAVNSARRVVTNDFLLSAKALIASTLNYKPEEIDAWDPNLFFIRLAQTEIATGRLFEPVDPKTPKDLMNSTQKKPSKILSSSQQKAINRTKEDRSIG